MTQARTDLRTCGILPTLPSFFANHRDIPIPDGLIGSTIISFGAVDSDDDAPEGGGLVIEFRRPNAKHTERIVFAFNELGMWVEYPEQNRA